MGRSDLVNAVAEKAGIHKKDAEKAVAAFMETVMDTVADGDTVTLVGFGIFSGNKRPERKGKNPQTGEPLTIPARTVPVFKAGKAFKERVNK